MVSMAPPLSDMIADGVKTLIGPRLIDMAKTYKNGSYRAGRQQRLKGFMDLVGNSVVDIVWANAGQWTMQSANTLYNFDWNKSDKQIQDQINASHSAMFGVAGGVSATYLARSAGIGAIGSIKNRYPTLDLAALADAKDDNLDEIKSSINGALMAMRSNLATNAFLSTFMTGRHILGNAPKANAKNEPWIISEQLDKIVENQKDPAIKAYLTSFKDQAEDAVFDNIALIGNVITASYNVNLEALRANNGPERVVTYTPNPEDPSVMTFVHGNQRDVINSIETANLTSANLVHQNIGTVVATQAEQSTRADRNKKIITIFYRNGVNGAAMMPNGDRSAEKQIVLHNVKEQFSIKKLMPAIEAIQGGSYLVTAILSDGHHCAVYAISEAEGKKVLKKLIEAACIGTLIRFRTTEPPDELERRKPIGNFIPVRCWFVQHRNVVKEKTPNWVGTDGKFYQTKKTSVNLKKAITDLVDTATRYPWIDVQR